MSCVALHLTPNMLFAHENSVDPTLRSIRHKGLRRFVEEGDAAGLPAQTVAKLAKIIAFPQDMPDENALQTMPVWKPHRLSGDRAGCWSLVVTRNWRLTFAIDHKEIAIFDLDYEDDH